MGNEVKFPVVANLDDEADIIRKVLEAVKELKETSKGPTVFIELTVHPF